MPPNLLPCLGAKKNPKNDETSESVRFQKYDKVEALFTCMFVVTEESFRG